MPGGRPERCFTGVDSVTTGVYLFTGVDTFKEGFEARVQSVMHQQ